MKAIDFPFKIGMQYENWEFDLDIIETEKYDKYRYNKNDINMLFGFEINEIYLIFDLDILFKVEVLFNNKISLFLIDTKYLNI